MRPGSTPLTSYGSLWWLLFVPPATVWWVCRGVWRRLGPKAGPP